MNERWRYNCTTLLGAEVGEVGEGGPVVRAEHRAAACSLLRTLNTEGFISSLES